MISEREIMRYEEYIKTQFKKLDESSLIREDKIPDLDLYIDCLLYTSSEKPVSVLFNGESPANKEPVFLGVEPEHITITGASSAVKSVKNLQAVIDVSDVTSRKKSMNVQLKPVDKLGNEEMCIRDRCLRDYRRSRYGKDDDYQYDYRCV